MKTVMKLIAGLGLCLALYVAGAFTYGAGKYYFSDNWKKDAAFNQQQILNDRLAASSK